VKQVGRRNWTELNQLTFVEDDREWLTGDLARARRFYNEVKWRIIYLCIVYIYMVYVYMYIYLYVCKCLCI